MISLKQFLLFTYLKDKTKEKSFNYVGIDISKLTFDVAINCSGQYVHHKFSNDVQKYIAGFNAGDHDMILSCLTDDVVWYMPQFINLQGKEAFDKEIENDAFTGRPVVTISRMTEENNVVIAEGAVQCYFKNGDLLDAVFCDVFEMENGLIKKLTTFQMTK